jgi:hypothetical protein
MADPFHNFYPARNVIKIPILPVVGSHHHSGEKNVVRCCSLFYDILRSGKNETAVRNDTHLERLKDSNQFLYYLFCERTQKTHHVSLGPTVQIGRVPLAAERRY